MMRVLANISFHFDYFPLLVVAAVAWGTPVLLSLLPWVLFIALWWWLLSRASRNLGGGLGRGGALQDFLRPPTRKATIPDVTFNDVAGQENVKREVSELVDFLRNRA